MNFLLSEQQEQLKEQLDRRLAAVCGRADLHAFIDGKEEFFPAVWRELVDFGVPAMGVAAEYGGLGLEMIDLALISESIGYHAAPAPFLGHVMAELALAAAGSEEQKRRWLPLLASGERVATIAFAEAEGKWLPDQWTVPGTKSVSGIKRAVPNLLQADVAVVGLAGGGMGIVELDAAGVSRTAEPAVDRTHPAGELVLAGAVIDLLPGGPAAADQVFDAGLVLLAADAFGGAWRCIDMATEYVKQREQFGVKLAQFQGIRHQLANMATEIEPCRGLYWYAAHAFDHVPTRARHVAAMAKQHITDRYLQGAREAVELHGGIGYTWEYDVHIWFKRAQFDWAFLGNPTLHRERAAQLFEW